MGQQKHVVVQTDTRTSPSSNGWLYYYCQCNYEVICAAHYDHGDWFDSDGWAKAVEAFDRKHPRKENRRSQWGQ